MASHEHLQQLHDEDDTSTSSSDSSSSSDDSASASSIGVQDLNNIDAMEVDEDAAAPESDTEKPKRRIKLSLRLPKKTTQNGDTLEPSVAAHHVSKVGSGGDNTREEVVSATVVHSDGEEAEDVVEATVVEEAPAVAAVKVASSTAQSTTKPTKSRRSPTPFHQAGRPVRLPPLSSPGLLIPPTTTGVYRGDADANGFTAPNSVFTRAMSLAGYTTEGRTQNPHRGSSVQRVVGDMFDSNVLFTLHFPKFVPDELWNSTLLKKPDEEGTMEGKTEVDGVKETLPYALIRALSKTSAENIDDDVTMQDVSPAQDTGKRKRKPRPSFYDMAPVSLTIPYPESYIQKRLKYIQQVEERERAIVASQEASQAADEALEAYEEALAAYNSGSKRNQSGGTENGVNGPPVPPQVPPTVDVPPIPVPPSPPRQSEMDGILSEEADETQHPIYLPKGKEDFVSHLDKDCFHITDGRYYGLSTNTIADPHFVGPNAPGISGLNVSGGTGLATSYIGSSSGSGAGSSQAYYGGSVGGGSSGGGAGGSSKTATESNKGSAKKGLATSAGNGGTSSSKAAKRSNTIGPAPTSTSTDLKRFMEQDDAALVEQMKVCIIRAAVYASRTGMHGGSFVGTNLETYPDVSKAFAAHAGLRPCNRCKNNKQGAYHCRLRRKHKDIDYDGGNSWGVLAPLFEEQIESLLQK